MAEHVTIPAGINPGSAVPSDAQTYGSGNRREAAPTPPPGSEAGLPKLPQAGAQAPGFVAPAAAPAGVDATEFAEFQAFKAAQAAAKAGAPAQEQPKPATPALKLPELKAPSSPAEVQAAFDKVVEAGTQDPFISTTFETIALVAPNLDLARALGTAIERGDSSLIDRAYLRDAGGDKADRLIKLAENMVKHVEQQSTALIADIHRYAGGEQGWDTATTAFNTSAPDYLKQYVIDALNSANPTKIRQGAAVVMEFVKRNGSVPTAPSGHVQAGGGIPASQSGLSKAEYQAERAKLNRNDRGYNDAARELDARRAIGKKAGK